MDGDKITLDRETFKALAVDTRVKILKILDERQHTLSDLAEELEMAPSTIKEHLDTLVSAGLIKQEDKGMKWKYYKLTLKGRAIINPYEKKVWIVLATSFLALGVTAYSLFSRLRGLAGISPTDTFQASRNMVPAPEAMLQSSGAGEKLAENMTPPVSDGMTYLTNSVPHAGAEGAANNATNTASMLFDEARTAVQEAVSTTLNNVTGHAGEEKAAAGSGPVTDAVSSTWSAVSPERHSDSAASLVAQVPYVEIVLAIAFAALIGLCIGYLIKKRRAI